MDIITENGQSNGHMSQHIGGGEYGPYQYGSLSQSHLPSPMPSTQQEAQETQSGNETRRESRSSEINSILGTLWHGLALRANQVVALLWKNLIQAVRHPFNTLLHLFLPAMIVLCLFLLNWVMRKSTIAAATGDSGGTGWTDPKHPEPQPVPRLPERSDDAYSLFLSPCDEFFELFTAIANTQDPPLTIPPRGQCIDKIATDDDKPTCETDICIFHERSELEKAMKEVRKKLGKRAHAGIHIHPVNQGYSYDIMYNSTVFKRNPFILSDPYQAYFLDHSVSAQRALHEAILQVYGPQSDSKAHIDLQYRSLPARGQTASSTPTDNVFVLYPFAFYAALFLSGLFTHYSINNERDLRLREVMKMAGLRDSSFFLACFLTQSAFNLVSVLLMLCVGYATQLTFFINANPVPIFLLFFVTGESLIVMFMLMSTYISSNVWTNINAFIVLVIGFLPMVLWLDFVGLFYPELAFWSAPLGLQIFTIDAFFFLNILVPTWSFSKITFDITFFTNDRLNITTGEYMSGPGFSFTDMFDGKLHEPFFGEVLGDSRVPSSAENMAYILLSIFIFFVLTWYFDAALPGKRKRRLPPYFFLLPSYWGWSTKGRRELAIDVARHNTKNFSSILPDTDRDIYNEYQAVIHSLDTDVDHTQFPLKIVKLSKVYSGGILNVSHHSHKSALENITLSASLGEVLVILAHNGGGKSTMFNCLNGMLNPSSGDALIFGHSVINSLPQIAKDMGVVHQEDFFFPELTASQHIRLFATLRGVPQAQIPSLIKVKLSKVLLYKQRNQRVGTFSGGMKRRLSVAVATVGDPKIIFMDEPSSGLDVSVRRKLWNYISELKKDRLIVMTTHSMEEAEAVGDKIAILALGRLRAVGDPLHLKKRFGTGYSVELVVGDNGLHMDALKTKIAQISPSSVLSTEATSSLTYSLPEATQELSNLFAFLERESERGRGKSKADAPHSDEPVFVSDFLVSYTTLEEAFLTITHGRDGSVIDQTKKQFDDTSETKQLNVILETMNTDGMQRETSLGFVDIRPEMTLSDARVHIRANISNTPQRFVFLSDSAQVSSMQEKFKIATQFLPVVTIREDTSPEVDEPIWDPKAHAIKTASQQINAQDVNVVRMQQEMDHLRRLVTRLQQENSQLREQLTAVSSEDQNLVDLE